MSDIYKINFNFLDRTTKFIFCKREDYEEELSSIDDETSLIFVDNTIYGDDTITDVIKKISLELKKNIQYFENIEYENITGYLSTSWNYYSDDKIIEYLTNNYIDTNSIEVNNTILNKINKKTKDNSAINYDIIIKNINKYITDNNNNELVVGFYKIINKHKYYITPEFFENEVSKNIFMKNEYNKPINSICKYDDKYNKNIIKEFNFNLIENPLFVKYNNYNLLYNFDYKEQSNYELLENIYNINNKNLKLIKNEPTEITELKKLIELQNINILSLELTSSTNFNLEDKYNNLILTQEFPISIYYSQDKKKKQKLFKLSKTSNDRPHIKKNVLNKIIAEKNVFRDNNILIKFFIDENTISNIYLLENNKINIVFDFKSKNNINFINILEYINKILALTELKIGNRDNIESIVELNYLINNSYIKINNIKNDISSEVQYNIDLQSIIEKYHTKINITQLLFNYLILFTSHVDINVNEIKVLYKKNIHFIKNINKREIILDDGSVVENIHKLKILNNYINLTYKKSYYSNSYNYLEKFFKHIVTYSIKDKSKLLRCDMDEYKTQKLNNYLSTGNLNNLAVDNVNIKELLNYTEYDKADLCNNILHNTNKNTNINLIINYNVLTVIVQNIYSVIELENIENFFVNFIKFINITINKTIWVHNDSLYIITNNKLYNIYNNLYNIYNYPSDINFNQYYIDEIFKSIQKIKQKNEVKTNQNILDNVELDDSEEDNISDDDFDDDFEFDDDDLDMVTSDVDVEKESELKDDDELSDDEDINSIENYSSLQEYKIKNSNNDKKEILQSFFEKKYNKVCHFDRRPTVLTQPYINNLQKREKKDLIYIKGKNTRYFSDLINSQQNMIDIKIKQNGFNINMELVDKKKTMYKGRLYTFNITYKNSQDKTNKFVLLEGFENRITSDNIIQKNIWFYEEDTLCSYDDYLNNTNNKLKYKIEYNHRDISDNDSNKLYIGLYDLQDEKIKSIQEIIRKPPLNYLYDKGRYNDNYFVCLPGSGTSTQKITDKFNPKFIKNDDGEGICCYANEKHEIKDISDNLKKVPYDIKTQDTYHNILFSKEEDFRVPHLRISKIPIEIYSKITYFLGLNDNIKDYSKTKILNLQPYRLGLLFSNVTNNFIICMLHIIRYNSLNHKTIINKYFKYITQNIQFDDDNVKESLKNIINDEETISNKDLIKLNDNIYISDKLTNKHLDKLKTKRTNKSVEENNKYIISRKSQNVRVKLIDYIENNYNNLDIHFLWNLFSKILNLNIIIIENIYNQKTGLFSSIKCQNINHLVPLDLEKQYCLIFNYEHIYQPIIIQKNNSSFKMLFDFNNNTNNKFNSHNMQLLYNKCYLQNNNNIYNELLINMIYYNLSIDNLIILTDNDLENITNYRKYLVIDENSTKLGIIYEIDKKTNKNIFIPINNLKHNINKEYLDIETIYNIQLDKFIYPLDTTKDLIEEFYLIHNNNKLNINTENTKYITHNEDDIEYIIGIQLNSGDFIPVKKTNLLDVVLDPSDKLEEGYISYTNNLNQFDTKNLLSDLDKDEINNIKHYQDFIKYISNILSNINSVEKKKINDLINLENMKDLLIELDKIFKSQFNFTQKMDTINWLANDYTINNILNEKNLFNITKSKYDSFINILIYDLVNNKYKKKMILNNLYNVNMITKEENKHIQLDEQDITEYIINKLYNNILSDNFYHNLGINIDKQEKNIKDNKSKTIYCEKENYILDDENNKYTYYDFKPLLNKSDMIYTNCIYYHLGKHVFNYKKDFVTSVQQDLANILKEKENTGFFKLSYVVETYVALNKTHIYNNIINMNDLENIILSSKHILTNFDLLLLSEKYNIIFTIYDGNTIPMEDFTTLEYPNDSSETINVDLIEKNYYGINIYYYVSKIDKLK